ncbi:MAG TPA: protein kinase, partial [Candidatus Binatia bacterium]|nr:protein kinase [Candidatus Binatia bacterium]
MPRVGDCFAGRFDVLEELGTGTFGVVYRARQRSTGQLVALKLLRTSGPGGVPPRRVERFRRELAVCARLEHPHIVRLIDAGVADGSPWAAFAHVPGRTLRAILAAEGCLSWTETVRLMSQVADALACAHALGIVHRDLKPENILVCESGGRRNAVVLDFGLGAFAQGEAEGESRLTATQEILGTPCYAAPEQLRGEQVTPAADVYSWGLVFLECLTGTPAVSGASAQEVLLRQMGEQAIPIPAAIREPELRRLLAAATHKRAEGRTASIADILTALAAVEPARATPAPLAPVADASAARRQVAVLCVGIDLVGAPGARLDPEDEHATLCEMFRYVSATAERRGGRLVHTVGHLAVVCFGHAAAREEDTRLAAHAALDLVAGIERMSRDVLTARAVEVRPRVGLHVGLAVVSGGAGGPVTLLGTAAREAMDLAAQAAPGQIVVRDAARQALRRWFRFEAPAAAADHHVLLGEGSAATAERSWAEDEAVPLVDRAPQL